MTARVLFMHPPNFAAIQRAFNVRGKPVIFAFGDRIYNPGRIKISPSLFAHEAVHQERQGNAPEDWWDRYIADRGFRLREEIPAHRAEYDDLCLRNPDWRQFAAERIAKRLASPLYGSMVSFAEALQLIT